jgi:hypothetical protein
MWIMPTGRLLADRLQDRMGDRMVAADRQRHDAGVDDLADAALDVLMAEFQPVAAAERHVADVGDAQFLHRGAVEHVIVGSDAFDGAQRTRAEARAGPVGDAKIHRHADHRYLQIAEIRVVVVDLEIRCCQESRDTRIGCEARAGLVEDLVGDTTKLRVEQVAAMAFAILLAQLIELFDVETHGVLLWSEMAMRDDCLRPSAPGGQPDTSCSPHAFWLLWGKFPAATLK